MRIYKEVKSTGKAFLLLFSYFILLIIYMVIINRLTAREGGDFYEHFLVFLLMFLPLSIAAMYLPLVWINKKKIPRSVEIDKANNFIEICFFKKTPLKYELNDIAYHKINNDFVYILILYKKVIATRGHTIHKQFMSIAGTNVPIAWKEKDLIELTAFLDEAGVEHHIPVKEKHISDYFFFE